MAEAPVIRNVLLTGSTGFVGRNTVRELLAHGLTPVCIVRSRGKLARQHPDIDPERWVAIIGNLSDQSALREAAEQSQAAIHLVGIILARRLQGQTFQGIHARGTQAVLEAVKAAGIRRYVHMSALGTRPDGRSAYHRTKWQAEEYVGQSRLDWTIFRPSLIHGPDGELMRLLKRFVCRRVPPLIPYFGNGQAKVQPVSVKDVAHCLVAALSRDETIGQIIPMGGPRPYSWIELYNTCRALMPGARHWKPLVSLPVPAAKLVAALSAPPMALAELFLPAVGMYRFDSGQVQMAQEDSTCDHTIAERIFGIRMRSFEDELSFYAGQIG